MTRPQVWGHRGAMDFAPQNTLESFVLAQEQGADGVELDVQLTKDGVLVVFHDAWVDDLTDGKGPLANLPWAVVRKLDAGSHLGRGWAGARIPTLEEVLSTLDSRMTVNIELKTALSEETWWDPWRTALLGPQKLSEALLERARHEAGPLALEVARVLGPMPPPRFLLSSFDPLALEAVEPLLPTVPRGFLHSRKGRWDTPSLMAGRSYQAWHPHHLQVSAEAVAQEHAAGRKVHVWTVNDPAHARRLGSMGVNAVITNRPQEILAGLA